MSGNMATQVVLGVESRIISENRVFSKENSTNLNFLSEEIAAPSCILPELLERVEIENYDVDVH